ncbi:hypothetical protein U1Q18_036933 [Sarracenia purpurea var. burkii]
MEVMLERMKVEKEEGRGRGRVDSVAYPPARRTTPLPMPAKKPDKDEGVISRIAKLNERLKKLNSYSSIFNILTLMALTWHLVYLGQRLRFSC